LTIGWRYEEIKLIHSQNFNINLNKDGKEGKEEGCSTLMSTAATDPSPSLSKLVSPFKLVSCKDQCLCH
jgi:hypothetical protein